MLLTRDAFRSAVFLRDKGVCVLCGRQAQDAHHILERRLWPDGGYYLENGASVCGLCHFRCESTEIAVETVRAAAGIARAVLPPHLYADQPYDKWGNPILPNGLRLRGELFHDESVQKVLHPFLYLFTHWVKYPRTYHLPWSEDVSDDDRVLESLDAFVGQRVIVTEKMDGENTTMYSDHLHARSVDSEPNFTQHWVKGLWGALRADIPLHWRICGENLFATHSIHYTGLAGYFLGFSVWNDRNACLDWDATVEWFRLLDLPTVPVLYDGLFDSQHIRNLYQTGTEGYVVRLAAEFPYAHFRNSVGKFVRKDHVKTSKHWLRDKPIIPNELQERL